MLFCKSDAPVVLNPPIASRIVQRESLGLSCAWIPTLCLPVLSTPAAGVSVLVIKHAGLTPASKPLPHCPFCLILFYTFVPSALWFIPSLPSGLCSDATSSVRPSLISLVLACRALVRAYLLSGCILYHNTFHHGMLQVFFIYCLLPVIRMLIFHSLQYPEFITVPGI